MESKTCTKCLIEKPLDEFYNEKRVKDGKQAACKKCTSKQNKQWAENNKERKRELNREWEERNRKTINCLESGKQDRRCKHETNTFQHRHGESHT